MGDTVTYSQGYFMPIGGRIFGIASFLFAFGILNTFETSAISLAIIIFLSLIGIATFATIQIVIDTTNNTINTQTICLGLKSNNIVSLEKYCYVTILNQLYSQTSSSKYTPVYTSHFGKYDVVLLNQPHHLKLKIGSYDNLEDAQKTAKELSELLKFEIVKFNPVRTRRRN